MDFLKIIKARRSIRSFKPDKLDETQLQALKDAIKYAPSAGNLQSRVFYIVRNQRIKEQIVEAAYGQSFIAQAPVVFVGIAHLGRVAGRYGRRGTTLYCLQDVAASVQNLMLSACSLGLGSCWVGAFDEVKAAKILELPKELRPVVIVPVGYAGEKSNKPTILSDDELFKIID